MNLTSLTYNYNHHLSSKAAYRNALRALTAPCISFPLESRVVRGIRMQGAVSALSANRNAAKVFSDKRYYEFTQDEIKALEECDKESFYQRCLPFSTLFATVTYAAMRWGLLKKNPHFGMVPKVLIAALFGHFYGRYAYIEQCDQKLRALPENSHLGSTMRKYHLERNPPSDPNKKR